MSVNTYLIDIADFQRKANLSQNLNTDKLKAQIGITQEKYAVQVLCRNLYDEIISQYPDSLSVANTALLPYIQDYLVYKTYARYLVSANLQASPAGMRVMTDSKSSEATVEQMSALIRQAEGDANFYKDQLVNFLVKNEDTYPLWKNSICNCSPNNGSINQNVFTKIGSKNTEVRVRWT